MDSAGSNRATRLEQGKFFTPSGRQSATHARCSSVRMKSITLLLSILLVVNAAQAEQHAVLARVTAYWKAEGSGVRACWNGARLNTGHCAVDPKKIPYGSKIIFPDTTCIAVDSGPDVVNRKAARLSGTTATQRAALVIDRFFDTRGDAEKWMAEHGAFMTVQVEEPEDRHRARSTSSGAFQLSLGLDAPVADHLSIPKKSLPQPRT